MVDEYVDVRLRSQMNTQGDGYYNVRVSERKRHRGQKNYRLDKKDAHHLPAMPDPASTK